MSSCAFIYILKAYLTRFKFLRTRKVNSQPLILALVAGLVPPIACLISLVFPPCLRIKLCQTRQFLAKINKWFVGENTAWYQNISKRPTLFPCMSLWVYWIEKFGVIVTYGFLKLIAALQMKSFECTYTIKIRMNQWPFWHLFAGQMTIHVNCRKESSNNLVSPMKIFS